MYVQVRAHLLPCPLIEQVQLNILISDTLAALGADSALLLLEQEILTTPAICVLSYALLE